MKYLSVVKQFLINALMLFACIILTLVLINGAFGINVIVESKDIRTIFLIALVCSSTNVVFFSKKVLTEQQIKVRMMIHFLLVEVTAILAVMVMDLVEGMGSYIVLAIQIAIIYFIMKFLTFSADKKEADEINQRLASKRWNKE